jgi:hypothetical protein
MITNALRRHEMKAQVYRTLRSLAAGVAAATVGVAAWSQPIERLEPTVFTQVPASVRSGMTRLGCTVPQTFMARRPENVIHGSFTARAAREWAVLCSVSGTSEILVFRANSERPIARFAEVADETFVQSVAPGRSGYSRLISAGPRTVAGLNPIHDAYIEKASTVWVRVGQRWQAKAGTD